MNSSFQLSRLPRTLLLVLLFLSLSSCAPASPATPSEAPSQTPPTQAAPSRPPAKPPVSGVIQSKQVRQANPEAPLADLAELADDNTAFALDFYQQVRSQPGNLFYSPYSLSLALAMTYAGAAGQTQAQMAKTLRFSLPAERLHPAFNQLDLLLASRGAQPSGGQPDQGFKLHIANSLWGQTGYTFLPAFLDTLAQNYGAGLHLADFVKAPEPSRLAINDWVSQQTADKIKDLIPQGAIDPLTRLVLANAIYFKASWETQFEPKLTQNASFHALDGGQPSVQMMSYSMAESLAYASGDGYQAVELPYLGGDVGMDVLVPDEGQFAGFEASLDIGRLSAILSGLKPQQVDLKLPKFTIESSFSLPQTLAQMGMVDAFKPEVADFSGMDGTHSLYISDVLHKAVVAVDENGTEAAAATAVIASLASAPAGEIVQLTVDRPFIFVIRDLPTNSILFVGRVVNPA